MSKILYSTSIILKIVRHIVAVWSARDRHPMLGNFRPTNRNYQMDFAFISDYILDTDKKLRSLQFRTDVMNSKEAIAARPKVPTSVYQPLCDWQTRLLKLSPRSSSTKPEVVCSLHVVDLVHVEGVVIAGTKKQVSYDALSYSWGRDLPSQIIYCNDENCTVSEQLEEALQTIRYDDRPRWIWCDAFCIDQKNVEEKSKQVQKAQIIFSKAEQVIVWLGPPKMTSRIGKALSKWRKGSDRNDNSLINRQEVEKALSKCAWLTRTWIRQEIQAARRIEIPSDYPDDLSWENLSAISEEAFRHVVPEPDDKRQGFLFHQTQVLSKDFLLNPLTLLYYINSPRRNPILLRNALHHRLTEWIVSMALFKSTEPADKVYGILGLFEPSRRAGNPDDICSLEVDYRLPLSKVFTSMMERILLQSQNLAWLEAHVFSPTARNERHLPSWVFDWEAPSFDILVTRHSQAHWAASSPNVFSQVRRLEIEVFRNDFDTIRTREPPPADIRYTWTVAGRHYATVDKVSRASDHERRDTSYLPREIFDLGLWKMATYSHSNSTRAETILDMCQYFYVVSWTKPGDVIVRLGLCPNFFVLRPVTVLTATETNHCFYYLGRAIARVSEKEADDWKWMLGKKALKRDFVLV